MNNGKGGIRDVHCRPLGSAIYTLHRTGLYSTGSCIVVHTGLYSTGSCIVVHTFLVSYSSRVLVAGW